MNRESNTDFNRGIGHSKNVAKFVPRILTDKQKQRWLEVVTDLSANEHMFNRAIMSDESWCVSSTTLKVGFTL